MTAEIPVILFAYARPKETAEALRCLRENNVRKLIVYSDEAKDESARRGVDATRSLLRAIDWADVNIIHRQENWGLGKNVLYGVDEVAKAHDAFIVWEDDLICTPGTYAWLCSALVAYKNNDKVGSVTGWTHPRVTPAFLKEPYFDGRAECWVWGAWSRSWKGMLGQTALEKMEAVERNGLSRSAYGSDLPQMAQMEQRKNIWAVRWLYHHLQNNLLCLRPEASMVEHTGASFEATNAQGDCSWANIRLVETPGITAKWPEVIENPECRALWQREAKAQTVWSRLTKKLLG